ncbi:CYTH and CHAD domain-containing protein [Nonomuraea cavernae]|uniref:CHAD domain-containing protein n=1 Tax=Nonomuraea cavernae TaxID=2045107 RepID=A0A917YVF0_9ACTN|nr:CYTH and CHAD domain-containing protein [Nonomuraea cavernae]MCA2186865.1 CYTH and CHAD domain-containing protein [Nonomuraea cavernae]GGO67356.1 CHAD domain-containing protein [Nonomuraea cavernae]
MGIEIEDKFDVPPDFEIPDLSGLAEVVGPKSHRLVALYYDTPDLRLAARGVTLRRRRGGDDAGWHLKLPKARGVRQEIARPLTPSTKVVPPELAELVRAYTRGAELRAVAELDTRRSVTLLRDGDTRLIEVADDQVKGTVLGEERRIARWREVEAEILDGDRALLAKVGKRLRKAGATPSDAVSKLARLLDRPPSPVADTEPGSAGRVVVDYLASQVAALLSQDPRVRRAEEDAVHQMRVASRRLRSALKAFKTIVTDTREVQEELRWLGTVLGEARDLEVIRARFDGLLDRLPPELVAGPVRGRLADDLLTREREAYARIRDTLSGRRYYALLDRLDTLVTEPRLAKAAAKPARKTLTKVATAGWDRVTKAYDIAQETEDPAQRVIALHDVRKAAKRARYTAEALEPTLGDQLGELAELAEGVQEVLGAQRDGLVAQQTLAEEAERARRAGEDTFTYGLLIGLERAAAERADTRFPKVWARTVKAVRKVI